MSRRPKGSICFSSKIMGAPLEAEALTCIVKSRNIALTAPWQLLLDFGFCLHQLPPLGIVNIDTTLREINTCILASNFIHRCADLRASGE